MSPHPGREPLRRWQAARTRNFHASNPNLQRVLRLHAGAEAAASMQPRLDALGATLAAEVDDLVAEAERPENAPRLRSWSGIGERIEEVDLHASTIQGGRLVWRHGVLAIQADRGRCLEQAAMIYLLAHLGEGGHACPVACTSGLIKALQVHGSPELQERYLRPLLRTDYDRAHLGSQFLTEVQGGSDVGANIVEATPDAQRPGAWRIRGEKWFCSVANADQFFVTARVAGRPAGTAGLGAFLVPRRLEDGTLNAFRIRRLKTKLGTRAMASGEMDFEGALAFPIGDPSEGFKIAVGLVLNTSRWVNALGSTGLMRRACLEAIGYASAREAFGRPILQYPMVRETLAMMKCEEHAALASTLHLSVLLDRLETGRADAHEKAVFRFLVNANKYVTSIAASEVAHGALEVFGGNGAIEDFSVVPRLLRDNFVYESWEGTHNVLAVQVLRDGARLALFPNVHDEMVTVLEGLEDPGLRAEAPALTTRLSELSARIARSLASPEHGATHFRRQLTEFTRLFQAVRLLWEADGEKRAGDGRAKTAVAQWFVRRHLLPGYLPENDPDWKQRIDAILAEDIAAAARA